MTTPIPLTKPDGTVHAYACGNCGFLHCGWSHGGGWNEHDADRTRTEAERCCTCRKCGVFVGSSVRYSCEACCAIDSETVTLVPKGAVVIDCQSAAVFADVCAKIVVQLDALSSAPNGMMTLMALRDLLRGGR